MEHLIGKLLSDFEQGRMDRRQLIRSLALAATAAAVPAAAEGKGFQAVAVNHIFLMSSPTIRRPGIFTRIFSA